MNEPALWRWKSCKALGRSVNLGGRPGETAWDGKEGGGADGVLRTTKELMLAVGIDTWTVAEPEPFIDERDEEGREAGADTWREERKESDDACDAELHRQEDEHVEIVVWGPG